MSKTTKPKRAKPAEQQQPQPDDVFDTYTNIKLLQDSITSIRTALHRNECAIQAQARNGYFSTVQHLQQASVHMREAVNESERMIERIKTEATRPNA